MRKPREPKWCAIILLLFALNIAERASAQNVYDTYNPFNPTPDSIVDPYPYDNVVPNFIGEYQLFTDGLEAWQQNLTVPTVGYSISYRIEPVGFPFVADCNTSNCGDSTSTTRNLIMPNSLAYGQYVYAQPFNNTADTSDYRTMSAYSQLMSNAFTTSQPLSGTRDFLPHTALKHTYYLHAGATPDFPVLDSFSFVLDHTRGFMSEYPFSTTNYQTYEVHHDITIIPWFIYPTADSFLTIPAQTGNFMGTIDYYPYPNPTYFPDPNSNGWYMTPDPNSSADFYASPYFFGHPAPYTLLGVMLGNAHLGEFAGSNDTSQLAGLPHTYYIDKALDFRTINPREKIIYNPSKAFISAPAPVVFPSGYTFMTVGGKYPTAIQLAALDPNNMYGGPANVPQVDLALNLTNNPYTSASDAISIYEVLPGCTLTIEPCVTLFDCKITVDSGGVIQYDSTSVYGNWSLTILTGGTQVQLNNDPTVPCRYLCYEESNYNERLVHITTNTTWDTTNIESSFPGTAIWSAAQNNTAKFVEGIVVDSGATLTVGAGVNLLFGPLGKIIIKKGGRLVATGNATDSCYFGPACQMEWKGVEVWGDPAISQHAVPSGITPQGWLSLEYCSIEHARDAVTIGCRDTSGKEGGVINADRCSFLNNVRDVVFLPYRNFSPTVNGAPTLNNKSGLTRSEFRTTEYFYDPALNADNGTSFTAATAHIALYGVKNVAIHNCTFANDAPANYRPHLRGAGVYGFESGLLMRAQYPNTFENLSDAVWMQSSGLDGKVVNITGSVFVNNIHSVVLEGTRFSAIFRNEIDVPESEEFGYTSEQLEKGYDKPVGIFLLGCVDYNIWENEFNVGDTAAQLTTVPNCDNCCYDVVVYHSAIQDSVPPYFGTGTGKIYNNQLHHASIGIQAQGDNGQALSINGLEVSCNEFDELVLFDFAATGRSGLSPVSTTMRDQGDCPQNPDPELLATNFFLSSCSGQEEVNAGANTVIFAYTDDVNAPTCSNVLLPGCPSAGSRSCTSYITWGWYQPTITVKYQTATTNHQNARHMLDSLVDCGDTEDLLGDIEDMTGDALNTRLRECTPWLSDEVMITLLASENREKLTEEQLVDLLLDNGRLSSNVWSAVLSTSPALSDGSMSLLDEAQATIGVRELLERNWATWAFQADLAANELTTHAMINDSLEGAIDVLDSTTAIPEMQKLFALYFAARDFTNADATLINIINAQTGKDSPWTAMARIALTQADEDRTWLSATMDEYHIADSIWNAHPEREFGARSIVSYYSGKRFAREPFGLESGERRSNPVQPQNASPTATNGLLVYPNPANTAVTIVASSTTTGPLTIEVLNPLGQKVDEITVTAGTATEIDISAYAPGMLYLRLTSQGIGLTTEKLMIIR